MSKFPTFECYYNKKLQYFGAYNVELHYMDRNSFIYSAYPLKCLFDDLKCVSKGLNLSEVDPFD